MSDKRKRTSAKGRFTRVVNCLESLLQEPDRDKEIAEKFFYDVENAWKNVEEKHEEYISALDEGDADLENEERWITEVQKTYHDIRKRYVRFKSTCLLLSELSSKEKARCVAYEAFLKLSSNLQSSVANKYPAETITREKIILERQFEVVKGAHSEYYMLSDNRDERPNIEWLTKLIEEFAKFNSIADTYLKTVVVQSEHKTESKTDRFKSNIKMEHMPLPKFYGEARFYPRFKRDFDELIRPRLEKREAAFTLRQCLGKNVECILGSGDYDLDQLFQRLDEKYGDPSKMTDSIICEIQKF